MPLAMKDVGSLRVVELKEECRARGLKVGGAKQELVDRLKLCLRTQAKSKAKACVEASLSKPTEASAPASKPFATLAVGPDGPSEDSTLEVSNVQMRAGPEPEVDCSMEAVVTEIGDGAKGQHLKPTDFSAAVGAAAAVGVRKTDDSTSFTITADANREKSDQVALCPTPALLEEARIDGGVAELAPLVRVAKAEDSIPFPHEAAPDVNISLADSVSESTEATAHCAKSLDDKRDRSRSPAARLESIPTASRRRHGSPLPMVPAMVPASNAVESEGAFTRSRSPSTQRVAGHTGDQAATTPSKFTAMLGKLNAKAEAKERGEEFLSSWTPRASPLRSQMQHRWQTPPRGASSTFVTLLSAAGPDNAVESAGTSSQTASAVPPTPPRESQASLVVALPSPPCATVPPAALTPIGKRQSLQEGKKQLLQELTEKLQACLRRMQDRSLDERSVEKYQELAKAIRKQMDTISIHPERSPAFARSPASARSPAFPCSPAASWRF